MGTILYRHFRFYELFQKRNLSTLKKEYMLLQKCLWMLYQWKFKDIWEHMERRPWELERGGFPKEMTFNLDMEDK